MGVLKVTVPAVVVDLDTDLPSLGHVGNNKTTGIVTCNLQLAVCNSEEFHTPLGGAPITRGGVLRNIQ
ncbi:hypothetical protein Q5P01_006983 [Channa striata]|uniref:Uncharacterized protein n=1 Tax=Channa striata TaxID=64152 RepID=A0AA88N9W3_CHASR|nr:hypothetical protein Q5P01_006983 [Channa striata]